MDYLSTSQWEWSFVMVLPLFSGQCNWFLEDYNLVQDFTNVLANVRTTWQWFRGYSLKLKPKKCDLFCSETEFLGKVGSSSGISIALSKIEAVKGWPRSVNQNEFFAFLGFLNYHREHLKDFASLSACLYDLHKRKFFCGKKHLKRLSFKQRLYW